VVGIAVFVGEADMRVVRVVKVRILRSKRLKLRGILALETVRGGDIAGIFWKA
jgi:hypothetical protein